MQRFLYTLVLLFPLLVFAQPEHRVAVSGKTIEFKEIDNLEIVGYDGNEMKITRRGGSQKVAEKTEGLRKISASGLIDNTGFGLSAQGVDGKVLVRQVGKENGTIVVHVPNSATVDVTQSTHRGGDLTVESFSGELNITMMYHDIILTNVYGAVAANCVYGDITATFSSGPPTKDLRLHSTYSNVDLTLPNNTKANLQLYTGYGDMYTDFDIQMKANMDRDGLFSDKGDDNKPRFMSEKDSDHALAGTINGGGVKISLQSSYEDIYLRKLK